MSRIEIHVSGKDAIDFDKLRDWFETEGIMFGGHCNNFWVCGNIHTCNDLNCSCSLLKRECNQDLLNKVSEYIKTHAKGTIWISDLIDETLDYEDCPVCIKLKSLGITMHNIEK